MMNFRIENLLNDNFVDELFSTHKDTSARADRRRETRKANRRLRKVEPLTAGIRINRNGGVVKCGDPYRYDWERAENRKNRQMGKSICSGYIPDETVEQDPFWEPKEYFSGIDWEGGLLVDSLGYNAAREYEDSEDYYDLDCDFDDKWDDKYEEYSEDGELGIFAPLKGMLSVYGYKFLKEKGLVDEFVLFVANREGGVE